MKTTTLPAANPHPPETSRFRAIWYMLPVVLAYSAVTRLVLFGFSLPEADPAVFSALRIFTLGAVYDLAFYGYALIPVVAYLWLAPNRLWNSRPNRLLVQLLVFATLYGLGFIAVAEFLFWDEFSVRFNFISVDYLVYRREVTDNISESYPLGILLALILAITLPVYWRLATGPLKRLFVAEPFRRRTGYALGWLLLPAAAYLLVGQNLREDFPNNFQSELASNGPYQFIAAFRSNELDYYQFYKTLDDDSASTLLSQLTATVTTPHQTAQLFDIHREVDNPGEERRLNIFLIMVESLSAKYLGSFGDTRGLTPNLDGLAADSLFFTRFYATGTRTTRGLEAVTLSIPPTPGRSIVKRTGSEGNLWSLGNVLKEKDYAVKFIYGGRGYFDNMNGFFSGNGYQVIDQSSVDSSELAFTNAWGMSDEDLYHLAVKEADAAHAENRPFFFHLMTTSNHRPYTYPEGRIDIPSGDGRSGAVRYTDWALGDLLATAREKPWFSNTVFVIVADHCAGSAGAVDLPLDKYHIPLFIYSPGNIQPQTVTKVASQIDLAPTLLALLNMDYTSSAFGLDIATMRPDQERALIGNYQKLGLYKDGILSILSPQQRMTQQLHPESPNPEVVGEQEPDSLMRENIAYYEGASYIYKHHLNAWNTQHAFPHTVSAQVH